jgi:hypothetical protein
MNEKHAIIIAVENYQDRRISSVTYAENDAKKFASVIEQHGFQKTNTTILINDHATKTRIESIFRTILRKLHENDQLFIFYAGHGFSDSNKNYITCHDTIYTDLTSTSVSLQSIFNHVQKSECQKAIFFIDSCHSGLDIDESMRGMLSEMTDEEFENFCNESKYHVVFASCHNDESSFSSNNLKHGIWTYHIIEAFNGSNRRALERKVYLTTSSLQNYLSSEVPITLKNSFTSRRNQTPRLWGNLSREFIIADFKEIFNRRRIESKTTSQIKKASFLGFKFGSIKSLSGFKKGYRIPEYVSDTTRSFVRGIGDKELTNEANQIFSDLQSNFKYKRREISFNQDDGSASILTPDFSVYISIDLDEEDLEQYIIKLDVSEIKNPDSLASKEFADTFDNVFDRTSFYFTKSPNIEKIIDRIEDINIPDKIKVEYPADASNCTIFLDDFSGYMSVDSNGISLIHRRKTTVKNLLEITNKLPNFLIDNKIVGLLPN